MIVNRTHHFASYLLCTLSLVGLAGAQEDPPPGADPAQGAPEKDPELKSPAALEELHKAKSLYGEGKYKEAEALFKKVKGEAKGEEDKKLVDRWQQAATGAQLLEKCKQRAQQNLLQQAYQEAESYYRKYQGTPIEAAYRAFLEEVGAKLFVLIEGFDRPSAEYSEKFGKYYINDPALLLDGTSCLRWASTRDRKDAALKIRDVPTDWSKVEAVELWVNIKKMPPAPEVIIACGNTKEGAKPKPKATPAKKKAADAINDFYRAQARVPGQTGKWLKIRIPMSDFQAQGQPSLTSVTHVQIQLQGGREFDFLIDKITLAKKDGGGAAEAKKK